MKKSIAEPINSLLIVVFASILLFLSLIGTYFFATKITIFCNRTGINADKCIFARQSIINIEKYSYKLSEINSIATLRERKHLKIFIKDKDGHSNPFPLEQLDKKIKYDIADNFNKFLSNKNDSMFVYENDPRLTVYCIGLVGFIAFYLIISGMISRLLIFILDRL